MKVYISNYRHHWVSPFTIMEKVIFWREIDYDEPFIKKCNKILSPFCTAWMNLLDVIHPDINYVKIERYDVWSMDHTLARIVTPMLKKLRDTKHGSPMVDDEDVPEHLRSVKKPKRKKNDARNRPDIHAVDWEGSDGESTIHLKWDWVLNEMIWAFEQKLSDDDENQFFDHSVGHGMPWDKDYVGPNVDWDGLKAHQARKTNGFRLLGKYYEGLWD